MAEIGEERDFHANIIYLAGRKRPAALPRLALCKSPTTTRSRSSPAVCNVRNAHNFARVSALHSAD